MIVTSKLPNLSMESQHLDLHQGGKIASAPVKLVPYNLLSAFHLTVTVQVQLSPITHPT